MSKKDLDFRNKWQGGINCILLSKKNFLRRIFYRNFSYFSFFLYVGEKFWDFRCQSVGNDVETGIFCPQDHFEEKKLSFENLFSGLFLF